jgi:hypothetical protein
MSLFEYRKDCDRKPRRFNYTPKITVSIPQFKERFKYSSAEHEQFARDCLSQYAFCKKAWAREHAAATSQYGSTPTLISGIGYAGLAPDNVKDRLRMYSRDAATWAKASEAHWRAAGRLKPTWLKLFNETKESLEI